MAEPRYDNIANLVEMTNPELAAPMEMYKHQRALYIPLLVLTVILLILSMAVKTHRFVAGALKVMGGLAALATLLVWWKTHHSN